MTRQPFILLIEGSSAKTRSYAPGLRAKNLTIATAHTGPQATQILSERKPSIIIIDSTSLRSSGARIWKSVHNIAPRAPLIYICAEKGAPPKSINADIVLKIPFTVRKLINRINRLLPTADGPIFQAGSLTLFLDRRSLLKGKREHRLTPKQSLLLETLMRHPNQVISRLELMRRVWETEFMEDTRTLDVHIRWVREVVEDNPSKPRYITTVRGKGYRFAVPADETIPRR